MKIRKGFVSNSSSSSFVIAYDPHFFGDLVELFESYYTGCGHFYRGLTEFYDIFCISGEELENFKSKVHRLIEEEGKSVAYLDLDRNFGIVIELLKRLAIQNGADKFNIIWELEE